MFTKLITPPTDYPITLEQAKEALGYYCSDDDNKVQDYIASAVDYAQDFQKKRVYITQTWEVYLDAFTTKIELPKLPVQSITHIKYKDSTGTETTIDDTDYILSNEGYIVPAYGKLWPTFTPYPAEPIRIEFVAGYEPDGADLAANVPQKIKQALILLCKHFDYVDVNGRDNVADELMKSAELLLWMDRAW